jgi:hypothetical protein
MAVFLLFKLHQKFRQVISTQTLDLVFVGGQMRTSLGQGSSQIIFPMAVFLPFKLHQKFRQVICDDGYYI